METNVIIPNKKTLNKAYVLFDDQKIAKAWMDVLISTNTEHTKIIWVINGKFYYVFKMFRIRNTFFDLAYKLKEVVECFSS